MPIYYEAKTLERAIDTAPRITPSTKSVLKKIIRSAPVADVVPVKHGQWGVDGVYIVCSVCNRLTLSPIVKQLPTFKYCPNCGARMDEEDIHE